MHTTVVSWPAKIPQKNHPKEQISTRFEKDTLTKASMVGCYPQDLEMEKWGMGHPRYGDEVEKGLNNHEF